MQVSKATYFHVSDQLNWEVYRNYFAGKDYSPRYHTLMGRSFFNTSNKETPIPLNAVLEGTAQYLQTQENSKTHQNS